MKLTETFNKATVSKGEIFQIELPDLGTTGQLWHAKVVSGQADFLGKTITPGSDFGGSAVYHFNFRAREAGEIEIQAELKRPWEPQVDKSQTFKLTVK